MSNLQQMTRPSNLQAFQQDNGALIWTGNAETVRIDPWGDNSVRIRASKLRITDDDWALLPQAPMNDVRIDIEGDTATLRNGCIVVRATASNRFEPVVGYLECRLRLRFEREDGTLLFEEDDFGGSQHRWPRDYTWYGESTALDVRFLAPRDEHLYGMGEYQQSILDLKGSTLELAHRNSQASVPFVVSSAGYGFLWHNPAIGQVSFASNVTIWHADASNQIDYWVTAGDTYQQIERQYADATGHVPNMPEWGMGFWQCKLRYANQEQVLDVAREFKRRDIPLDLIVVDFFHWPHMGDFDFEHEFWPDPEGMVRQLHDMGIKVMVSVWPQIQIDSANYPYMKQHNLLVQTKRGLDLTMKFQGDTQFYDATNPQARTFVWEQCRRHYAERGFDAFWLDEAEPEYGTYDFDNYVYFSGTNERVGNVYPQQYNRGFYEGQLEMGREHQIVNLTRCAWAGSQRYGSLVWSGDVNSTFEDLKTQITCAIHLGMAGIPWFTTDMGGFHDGVIEAKDFHELLVRWCQFSCFSPVMRNHGDRSTRATENGKVEVRAKDGSLRASSGADNEPWSFGDEAEAIITKYIRVREMLRPYLRQLFASAHAEGQPIIRGLFYEFPNDEKAALVSDEYMLGSDLLVAPTLTAGTTQRCVYLPGDARTSWVEIHTGLRYLGGDEVIAQTPLDVIAVFARDGQDHDLAGAI